jgi:hypothetical protein
MNKKFILVLVIIFILEILGYVSYQTIVNNLVFDWKKFSFINNTIIIHPFNSVKFYFDTTWPETKKYNTSSWSTINDKNYNYSFKCPRDWEIRDGRKDEKGCFFTYDHNNDLSLDDFTQIYFTYLPKCNIEDVYVITDWNDHSNDQYTSLENQDKYNKQRLEEYTDFISEYKNNGFIGYAKWNVKGKLNYSAEIKARMANGVGCYEVEADALAALVKMTKEEILNRLSLLDNIISTFTLIKK